jgi:molybdenum cofactor guanylyltransferase
MYISPDFSTLILAGGKATRMNGHDKGLVIWQNAPLINHVLKNLPKNDVVISCNRNLAIYSQYGRVVSDQSPDFAGPLAGIAAALPLCNHEWVLITACDMPCLPPNVAQLLWCNIADNKIAVAHDGEHLQPLLLLVHRSLAQNIQQSVNSGNSSVYKWLMQQPHHVVYFTEATIFTNVNSLEAL